MKILRSEIHVINKNHKFFNYCDDICFKSKNLYNYVNYLMRQEFITNSNVLSPLDLNKQLKNEEVYKELPSKTSQQVIIKLGKNWKSYVKAIKDWGKHREKYTGMPKLPKYKDKNGRNIIMFDYQQTRVIKGKLKFPKTNLYIKTNVRREDFRQIQIVPYGSCYKVIVIYNKEIEEVTETNDKYLAIDLGIDNLATLTNNIGKQPIVINGKVLKSVNQYYNKKLAKAMSYVGTKTSNRIRKLSFKRNNIVDTLFHKSSRWIINYCLENDIQNIVIGKNNDWKRGSDIGRKNNQNFVRVPFEKLIKHLEYKAEEIGIRVITVEEQYTSKSSFIDNDQIPVKFGDYHFSGRRIKRGLYKSKNGTLINADVNGSYNILRKCNPQFSYDERIEGVSLHPIRVNII